MYQQRHQRKPFSRRATTYCVRFVAMLTTWMILPIFMLMWNRIHQDSKGTFFTVPLVVLAQPHRRYRTCALHHNEPLYLYYNISLGMYVRYNNDTDRRNFRRLSSMDDQRDTSSWNIDSDKINLHQQRIRINNENIALQHSAYIKNSNTSQYPNSPTRKQLSRSRWYDYLMNQFQFTYYNDDKNLAEPAIAMTRYSWHDPNSVSPRHHLAVEHEGRSLQAPTGSNTAFDGHRINDIDPNIELYQPYDGRIVSVRSCHCSDRNNNNNFLDNIISNYSYYCPVNKNYCYVPIQYGDTSLSMYEAYPYYYHPVCIPAPSTATYLAQNIKLIGSAALALIFIFLLVSPAGHHAIRCCCSTLIPGCFNYNQRYIDYMIEKNSKLTRFYNERFMKDNDREERFNQRYIELQRLHGETVEDERTIPNNNRNLDSATGPSSIAPETSTVIFTPLNELEESIVRDMFYYRPSLLLKTRTYKGSSLLKQQQLQTFNKLPPNNSDNNIDEIAASSPYDADILILNSTKPTEGMNTKSDNGNTPCRNDDGCMICFNAIHIGSKVGVLPNCQHIFHSECLKDWLKRRNVCPLCLDSDVATVAFSRKNDPVTTIETPPPSIAAYDSSSPISIASRGP